MSCLITGGAGFVGASLALCLKQKYPLLRVVALDNLKRRGSELNIPRLKGMGVEFIHGDIRNKEDMENVGPVETIIECAAEPSVLAGYASSPEYVINTNLLGTINCLEYARRYGARFILLSTSRVYPFKVINGLNYYETETRFGLSDDQDVPGCSEAGLTEGFPLNGARSLYGATKLASELLTLEYADMYGLRTIINRCGVITGPWQFGKTDQGVVVLWVARHFWNEGLSYIGFGAGGKQVRDILHFEDLFRLIDIQLSMIDDLSSEVFNVGGGLKVSVSLKELTLLCEKFTGNSIPITGIADNRKADIRIYLTDNTKVTQATGWRPQIGAERIVEEIARWIESNKTQLEGVLR